MTRMNIRGKLKVLLVVAATAATCTLAGCGGEGPAASKDGSASIMVLLQPSAWISPALLAQKQGFFKDEGLDVKFQTMPNQAAQVPLLVSDQAQFAVGSNIATSIAVGQGLPFQLIASSSRNETEAKNASVGIVVLPDSKLKSGADLVGQRVAMPALKGASEWLARVPLEIAQEDPNAVKLVQLAQASGLAALDKGEVDAALVFQPFLAQALANDYRPISYPALEAGAGDMFSHWYAKSDYLKANPEVAKKFVAAIEKANNYANENPDEANAILAEELSMKPETAKLLPRTTYGGPVKEDVVQKYLDIVANHGWNEKELPSAADLIWDGS